MYNIDGSFFIIETCLKVALTNSMIYLFQNVLLGGAATHRSGNSSKRQLTECPLEDPFTE